MNDKPWADLQEGDWVRFVSPTVVRSGRIIAKRRGSLNVQWLDIGERALPDAKHYYAQWKYMLHTEGHKPDTYLEYLDGYKPDVKTWGEIKRTRRRSAEDTELLDVHDVCAIVNLDPKSVRRRLRSGSLQGFRENGTRWRVARRDALELARKLGR